MKLFIVGVLLVLGATLGPATGASTGRADSADGHLSPHYFDECPPITKVFDYTQTDVVYVQETMTTTSVNLWPVEMTLTAVSFETATSYLPDLVTVTPLPVIETSYSIVTTPVYKTVDEYLVKTAFKTETSWHPTSHLAYVTPYIVTETQSMTKTLTSTLTTSILSTFTHYTTQWLTEFSTYTTSTHVYDTLTSIVYTSVTVTTTELVTSPVYASTTSVAATSTLAVTATVSCVPVQRPHYKGKGTGESVHEKMLRVKEYLRDKFSEAYAKGLRAFDVHIDKLKKKLEQSKIDSSNKYSLADAPSLRKVKTRNPLDEHKDFSAFAGLGASKGAGLVSKGTTTSGSGTDLNGNLGDLKSLAGALFQGFKSSAVGQLGGSSTKSFSSHY